MRIVLKIQNTSIHQFHCNIWLAYFTALVAYLRNETKTIQVLAKFVCKQKLRKFKTENITTDVKNKYQAKIIKTEKREVD